MSDSSSGPSWFPTPPPKPLVAPSAAKVGLGVLVVVLVVAAGGVALSSVGHSRPTAVTASTAVTPTTRHATPTGFDRRQAFEDCMKSMGAGSPAPRTRFGGGPSQHFRDAFGVCRSLLQTGALDPVAPSGTGTTVTPAA